MFVNRAARDIDGAALEVDELGLGLVHDLHGSVVHFFNHRSLVVADGKHNLGQRNTISVEWRTVNRHEVVRTWQYFAVRMHFDPSRVMALHIFFETGAESLEVFCKMAGSGLAAN